MGNSEDDDKRGEGSGLLKFWTGGEGGMRNWERVILLRRAGRVEVYRRGESDEKRETRDEQHTQKEKKGRK